MVFLAISSFETCSQGVQSVLRTVPGYPCCLSLFRCSNVITIPPPEISRIIPAEKIDL